MITVGTSYFLVLAAAVSYYRDYGLAPSQVEAKVKTGEIHIGEPPLQPGEKLTTIDGGRRYAIVRM